MEIYIVRHGETPWNALHLTQGQNEVPLSERGRLQAKTAYEKVKDINFDKVFVSPLTRTKETASIVAASYDAIYDPLLMEIDFASNEKLNYLEGKTNIEHPLYDFFNNPDKYNVHGGETILNVRNRSNEFFTKLQEKYKDQNKNILIITHAVFIRSTILNVLGLPTNDIWKTGNIDNCSITHIDNNFKLVL